MGVWGRSGKREASGQKQSLSGVVGPHFPSSSAASELAPEDRRDTTGTRRKFRQKMALPEERGSDNILN